MIEEKLTKIAEKVSNYNYGNYGRIFTPEQVFSEYVLYYEGIDFEMDCEVFEKMIDDFYMEEAASSYEFPMYTLKLDNLTKDEYEYFYERLKDICLKIHDATDSNWLKEKIESWFVTK